MLLAIQRGFVASLPWSPLAYAMAITIAVIPGASWAGAALPGLGSAAIISLTGWTMDSIFKPRRGILPPRKPPEGSWAVLLPLLGLLLCMAAVLSALHLWNAVRIVGLVLLLVPVVSVAWAVVQRASDRQGVFLRTRAGLYVDQELPGYKGELVLLMMAGYIGTVGAPLLHPLVMGLADPKLYGRFCCSSHLRVLCYVIETFRCRTKAAVRNIYFEYPWVGAATRLCAGSEGV